MANEELMRELLAHGEISRQGSVMARPQLPEWRRNLPQTLGPTAGTGAQAALDLLDALLAFGPSPLDAAGGGGTADNLAGIFREIGLRRVGAGSAGNLPLSAEQYLGALMSQPNYERFKHLSQVMAKKNLGESFPVARGMSQNDPLLKAAMEGTELPKALAVSSSPDTAARFAQERALGMFGGGKVGYVAKGQATPEAVVGLVPKRKAYTTETEYIVDPSKLTDLQMALKYFQDQGMVFPGKVDPVMNQALQRLPTRAQPALDPAEELRRALAEAAQPPR